MTKAYIVVEGEADKAFLERLLEPRLLQDVLIVVAEARYGILSLARSLLATRRKPVAVLMDTDSVDDDRVREERASIAELLSIVAGNVPTHVVTPVPTLEAFFFASPELLERFFGSAISSDLIVLGKRDPRGVLDLSAQQKNKPWQVKDITDILNSHDIQRIRETSDLKALRIS